MARKSVGEEMKFTGERVVPTDMHKNIDTLQQHYLRYVWALKYVVNKNVLDAACGTGYGTDLMRSVAANVDGWDISEDAIKYAIQAYQNPNYHVFDLDNPPGTQKDVIVTFETIEHLEDPQKFIDWCKKTASVVIGSIPINCPTEYHKHNFTYAQAIKFIAKNFKTFDIWYQDDMILRRTFEMNEEPEHGMVLFEGRR